MNQPHADPLSDIVALLRPHDCVAGGLDASGDWAIRFQRHAGMKCNAVLKGSCSLSVETTNERRDRPIRLEAGDCFILPHGRPFLISAKVATHGSAAETIYAAVPHGDTATYGGGGEFFMTGARFLLSGPAASALLGPLPPVIVVRQGARSAAIGWVLDRIAGELRAPSAGGALVIAHLSHVLLIEVMRHHLAVSSLEEPGWMKALSDPAIGRAIRAIHGDPAHEWTVASLAEQAAMSRTSFAVRFRRIVGQPPMAYLTQWRMLQAADRLCRSDAPISRIALEAGYTSESAFAYAFRQRMGQSPRRYAREANAQREAEQV